ncbi:MAG: guanylate kinase [Flavobacteriales bacterium]|nr:guanylate kinase [Flavobacteriales bacterium]MDG2263886.1 guanylate kinase [Flavobacteriales bacterium]
MGKLIVISAPSGAGKTSIVHHLLKNMPELSFSVSACSREKRDNETHGKDYYFLGVEGFQNKIKEDAFLEWEEVYENQYYGTLKSEIERIWSEGKTVIFDVDVIGGLNIKKQYPKECLSLFIMPPSVDVLRERLSGRGSESEAKLEMRLAKAEQEISKNQEFDKVILNDDFGIACEETMEVITNFINS